MPLARSTLGLASLGVVLLLSSIGGAMWVLRGPESPHSSAPPLMDRVPVAVCFGRVDVPSGVAALHPTQSGRIEEIKVKEGQDVPAGDLLLVLDRQLAEQLVIQARQDMEAAQVQL